MCNVIINTAIMILKVSLVFLLSNILAVGMYAQQVSASLLHPKHKAVLENWLTQRTNFRLATEEDCDCKDDIRQVRQGYGGKWKPIPNYQPYYAVGDFNSDGAEDFAVALVNRTKQTDRFAIIIFNGSFNVSNNPAPAFFEEDLNLQHKGFFFGAPHPKPYRLIIGPFESDNSIIFVPKGRKYIMR
jgi:hypothetical protein